MITGVDLISDSLAIMLDGSGGGGTPAVLDEKTITENGVYYPRDETPPLDGYNKVTVNVETYEEEYEEMKECCDEVLEVIQQYDPDYDPEDPTAPTIPEEIEDVIDDVKGYTFPEDTEYEDIIDIVPDPVEDVDIAVSLQWGVGINVTHSGGLNPDFPTTPVFFPYKYITADLLDSIGIEPYRNPYGGNPYYGEFSFYVRIITSSGNVIEDGITGGGGLGMGAHTKFTLENYSVDSTTGTITAYYRLTDDYVDQLNGPYYNTYSQLIGYGAAGHTFKAKNS